MKKVMKAKSNWQQVLTRLAVGALVVSSLAACNQNPEPAVLDFGDVIAEEGSARQKVPGAIAVGDPSEALPADLIEQKYPFPSTFPQACNTPANIVKNPKFMVGVVNGGPGTGNSMPFASISNWVLAAGSPQVSPNVPPVLMGHGNPGYMQMWGYKTGGEAVKQIGVPFAPNSAYTVYISAVQFNETTSVTPLRFRLTASSGATNPWLFSTAGQFIDDAVSPGPGYQTTWKMFGAYTLTTGATAPDTITLASSNTVPYAQANPKTVSWGRYDNVCILRKEALPEKADVYIKKDLKDAPLTAGGLEHYVLTIGNNGPGSSSVPMTVNDTLPAGLTLDPSFALTQGNWTCTTAISCTSNTPIPSGGTEQIVIPVIVTQQQGAIKNCASVKAPNDPNLQNNEACVISDVVPAPKVDLGIRKQLFNKEGQPTTTLIPGSIATYGLSIINLAGPIIAGPVALTDPIPAGLTLQLPVTPPNWNCAASTPALLSCFYTGTFPIPNGFTDNIKFNVLVSKKLFGKLENCAKVNVANDVDYGNNKNCHTAVAKNPDLPIDVGDILEQAQTNLETYLETSDTEEVAQTRATSGLKDTLKTQVRLGGSWSWGATNPSTQAFANLVSLENAETGAQYYISIHCVITAPPLRIRCTFSLENALSEKLSPALIDGLTQLERAIVESGDETIAREKATSGLKDTLKTQVRLAPGTTLTPLDGALENTFLATQEGAAQELTIKIECYVSYPPLKAGCTITISL